MTPADAAKLLTVAAAYDNRKPDADIAKAWTFALGDLEFGECRDAIVAHYSETSDWIGPAHIRARVRRLRAKRIAEFGPIDPPAELADDPRAEAAWIAEAKKRIGCGQLASPADLPNGRGAVTSRPNLRALVARTAPAKPDHDTTREEAR